MLQFSLASFTCQLLQSAIKTFHAIVINRTLKPAPAPLTFWAQCICVSWQRIAENRKRQAFCFHLLLSNYSSFVIINFSVAPHKHCTVEAPILGYFKCVRSKWIVCTDSMWINLESFEFDSINCANHFKIFHVIWEFSRFYPNERIGFGEIRNITLKVLPLHNSSLNQFHISHRLSNISPSWFIWKFAELINIERMVSVYFIN